MPTIFCITSSTMAHGPDTDILLERIANVRTRLIVSSLNITYLPTLPSRIRSLNCCNTPLTSLPKLPPGLQEIYCHHTPLKSLPTLPAGLQRLWCFHTQITVLPELPPGLKRLSCSNTPLVLQRNEDESIVDYNLRWRVWRKEQEELESKQRIQATTRHLKEEIIASAWHPDRFERWCLDEEEKKENDVMMG